MLAGSPAASPSPACRAAAASPHTSQLLTPARSRAQQIASSCHLSSAAGCCACDDGGGACRDDNHTARRQQPTNDEENSSALRRLAAAYCYLSSCALTLSLLILISPYVKMNITPTRSSTRHV